MNLPRLEADQLSVSEAQDRYGVGKTALNARIRHCGLFPLRSGTRTFLSREQLGILDALHDHLADGRGMADFPVAQVVDDLREDHQTDGERSAIVRSEPFDSPIRIDWPSMAAPPTHIASLRELLEFLSDCEERGWILPTSEVFRLLGAAPKGSGWARYGFSFEAAGTHGRETAWVIRRSSSG